jgi:hypothetical protein
MELGIQVLRTLVKAMVIENGGTFKVSDESLEKAHVDFDTKLDKVTTKDGIELKVVEIKDAGEVISNALQTIAMMAAVSDHEGGNK